MSKQNNLRKQQASADPTKCNSDNSRRPSVFERLGTKPLNSTSSSSTTAPPAQNSSDYCRNWASNGVCSFGKNCKYVKTLKFLRDKNFSKPCFYDCRYVNTHTLISPSKRIKKENATGNTTVHLEDPFKRLTSKIVKTATASTHSPDLNLEEWNQNDLEYEDEKVLERRRQLLQRELELQLKKDKEVHGKQEKQPPVKYQKKAMSSSSSSRTSSSSSSSSTSSSEDSSTTSTSDSRKKVKRYKKRSSGSADYDDDEDSKDRKRK